MNKFIVKLFKCISTRGWNKRRLAKELGTTPQTISNWFRGGYPNKLLANRIVDLLDGEMTLEDCKRR